jgi:hypothetical protein
MAGTVSHAHALDVIDDIRLELANGPYGYDNAGLAILVQMLVEKAPSADIQEIAERMVLIDY